MNYFNASTLLGGLVAFFTGLFVYQKNRKNIVYKKYLIFSLSVALWSIGYFLLISATDKSIAVLGYWIHNAAIFIPATHLQFVLALLDKHEVKKKQIVVCYLCSLFIALITFTPYYIDDLIPKYIFHFYIEPGMGYSLFAIHFLFWVLYSFRELFMSVSKSTAYKSVQLKYFTVASLIGFTGGGSVFLLTFNILIPPYGLVLFAFYPLVITYAIIRHRFMNINIVFKKTAAYSLAAGLLTGLFVALVLTITNLFSTFANVSSFKISIFAALLIALLFNPLRHRIQNLIDTIFYKKTYDYYATVRRVSSNLATMFDQDSIFKFIGDTLYDLMGLKSIHLLMSASGNYGTVYYSGKKHKHRRPGDKKEGDGEKLCLNNRSGIAGFYRRSDDIIVRDELTGMGKEADREAENIIKDLEPFQGEVAVPVFVDRKLVLLIILGGKVSGDMFSKEDMDLLKTISNQTAGSLKNARLYQEKINSERLASIGMMSATFAHEIRNPLTSLKTFAQLMPEKYNDLEFRETFSRIVVGEIEKIDGLISDLLDFSSRKKTARMNNYDLTELLDTIIEDIRGKFEFEKTNIIIEKNYNGSVIHMSGDAGKLKQAFGNIILNGCQAMQGEGILRVDIKAKGKYTDVEIRDTGEGIQPEDLPKIFDPFVTTKEMGVGLGLAISKRVIENHNGKIHVVSQPAKGTTFIISLPAQNE